MKIHLIVPIVMSLIKQSMIKYRFVGSNQSPEVPARKYCILGDFDGAVALPEVDLFFPIH